MDFQSDIREAVTDYALSENPLKQEYNQFEDSSEFRLDSEDMRLIFGPADETFNTQRDTKTKDDTEKTSFESSSNKLSSFFGSDDENSAVVVFSNRPLFQGSPNSDSHSSSDEYYQHLLSSWKRFE